MLTTPIPATVHRSVHQRVRPWWLWIVTAFAFPPAGLIGHLIAGPVDNVGPALLGGVITGTIVGTAQWAVLRRRGGSPRWIVATAAGLGVGLAAGAALVEYATSLAALMVMGAVCGASIGLAQIVAFARLRRHAVAWTIATAVLWAVGWAVTTVVIGVNIDDKWPGFGISGALVVAVSQSVLLARLVPATERNRQAATNG